MVERKRRLLTLGRLLDSPTSFQSCLMLFEKLRGREFQNDVAYRIPI